MESLSPIYIASFIISLIVFIYGYFDKKQSDADFKAFFEEPPRLNKRF